jgi:hypothetical protein
MPSNEFYDSSNVPSTSSPGYSSVIRGEFQAIEDGCDKLPVMAGNGGLSIFVDINGLKLEAVAHATALTRLGCEASANKDTLGGYAGLTIYKINFLNDTGDQVSFLTNSNSASRTYTFQDSDGTIAMLSDLTNNGSRNVLINGSFMVWQQATSHSTTGYGSDDMWHIDNNGSTFTNSRQTHVTGQTAVPNNPTYYCRVAVTSSAGASNFVNKQQRIENVATLSGGKATLSFYAKADASKDIAIEFVQNFGTGGSPTATVEGIGSTKLSLTTSWVLQTVTVDLPSISGATLGSDGNDYLALVIWMDAGSDFDTRTDTLGQQSGTFEFSDIQIESGEYASIFERKTYADILNDCLRYCHVSGNQAAFSGDVTSGQDYVAKCDLGVTMRAAPSVTLTNVANTNFAAGVGTVVATNGYIQETRTANGTGSGYFRSSFIADSRL